MLAGVLALYDLCMATEGDYGGDNSYNDFFHICKVTKNHAICHISLVFLDIFYSSISDSERKTLLVKLLMVSIGA